MHTTTEPGTQLLTARVHRVAGKRVQLELPDEFLYAQIALGSPYQIVEGDTVLAIGQEQSWFVIGVLNGTGPTTLVVPGDLNLCAPRGSIELMAAKGVHIKSRSVKIAARKLEFLATSVFEKFATATRWVKETLNLRAGRVRTRVEENYDLKAGRIVQRADEDVKIDGQKIHLG